MKYLTHHAHACRDRRFLSRKRFLDDLTDYEKDQLELQGIESQLFTYEGRTLSLDICIEKLAQLLPDEDTQSGQPLAIDWDESISWENNTDVKALLTSIALHAESSADSFVKQKIQYTLQRVRATESPQEAISIRKNDLRHLMRDVRELGNIETIPGASSQVPQELLDLKWGLKLERLHELQQIQNTDRKIQDANQESYQEDTGDTQTLSLIEQLLRLYGSVEDIIHEIFTYGHPDREIQEMIAQHLSSLLNNIGDDDAVPQHWVVTHILTQLLGDHSPALIAYRDHLDAADPFLLTRIMSGSQPFSIDGVLLPEPETLPGYTEQCYSDALWGSHMNRGCNLLWYSGDMFQSHILYYVGIELSDKIPALVDLQHDVLDLLRHHSLPGEYMLLEYLIDDDTCVCLIEHTQEGVFNCYSVTDNRCVRDTLEQFLEYRAAESILNCRLSRIHPDILELIQLHLQSGA